MGGFVLDFGAFALGYNKDRLLGVRSLLFLKTLKAFLISHA
ncbi:hypothetical protein [Helicobacter pylori]|nr:hypothetical protein [Helicobacter pylori]